MADIFLKEDVNKLLNKKHVVFMGDSNVRALYKDILCLSQQTMFIPEYRLKSKMENSIYGDKLVHHGPKSNGRNYREERVAKSCGTKFSFFFITRVYDNYVEERLKRISSDPDVPDVFVINSCLWDVTRWGPQGVKEYKENMKTLMKRLNTLLPRDCLVIWLTAPPIAVDVKGGFLLKELQFLKFSLRFHVLEANHYARRVVVAHGYDVLDVHYYLKMQLIRRTDDGVHWKHPAVRYILNLLLTHISLAWGVPLPHRYESIAIAQCLEAMGQEERPSDVPKKKNNFFIKNEFKTTKCVPVTQPSKEDIPGYDKENFSTPKSSNSAKHRKKKSFLTMRKNNVDESHHAFMNRMQEAERHKRIRQWQLAMPPPVNASPVYSPYRPVMNSPYRPIMNSPCHPIMNSPYTPGGYPTTSYGNYPSTLMMSPYGPSPHPVVAPSPVYVRHSPLLPHPASPYAHLSPVIPQPYAFPSPSQALKPNINFASNDNIPFATYF